MDAFSRLALRVQSDSEMRPSPKTLWRMGLALCVLALLDVLLTSIGILFFHAQERNPLIVGLANWVRWGSDNERIVLTVWLLKMTTIAAVLIAIHLAVKSKPARDDRIMFCGLLISLIVYVGVTASWGWYFLRIASS